MSPSSGSLFSGLRWQFNSAFLPAADRNAFQTMPGLLQLPMEKVTLDRRSGVSRLSLEHTYYVKTFQGKGSRLKHRIGRSRYQNELRNLRYFQAINLNTPELIAFGYETQLGLLQCAVLVTAEVTNAADLQHLLQSGDLYRNGIAAARQVLTLVAEAARTLHADGFYHKDLKPRNILVQQKNNGPSIFFFDCPSGHHPPRFLLQRGVVRDLAHLAEGLRGHVRRVDLLYMYKQYRGCARLDAADKALARGALCYYSERRMTRKRRLREARKKASAQ